MPTLITREEALRRIIEEGGQPACLMCALLERRVGPLYVVHEDEHDLVMLPRYVRRWGHVMVVPRVHVTTYQGVPPEVWARTSATAHRAARMVERTLRPLRCYLASVGSSAGELTQTSMHLHMHVIPLFAAEDRPADVFSWAEGVLVGEPHEWAELLQRYRDAWAE